MAGCIASARANAIRCCCPPESWLGNLAALPGSPTRANNSSTLRSIRALGSVESGPEAIIFLRRFATAANSKIRESLMLAYQALHARRLFPVGAEGVTLIDEVLLTSQSFTPTFTLRGKIGALRNEVESITGSAPAPAKQAEARA